MRSKTLPRARYCLIPTFRPPCASSRNPRDQPGVQTVTGQLGTRAVTDKPKADHLRSRAADALTTAELISDEGKKAILVAIADGYFRLAEQMEQHEALRQEMAKPAPPKDP